MLHLFRRNPWYAVSLIVGLLLSAATTLTVRSLLDQENPETKTSAVIILPPDTTRPSLPTTQGQAQWDKQDLDELLGKYGSGYDCPANKNAKKVADLKLCPDYAATLSFNELGKPVVVVPVAMHGVKPITLTATLITICGNDGVKGQPVTCADYWQVRWTIRKEYVALGLNTEYVGKTNPDSTYWSGPLGLGNYTGRELVSAKQIKSYEVYAGNPLTNISNEPLSNAQMAKS